MSKVLDPDAPDLLLARHNLAAALVGTRDYDRAEQQIRAVIARYEATKQEVRVPSAQGDLAMILQGKGLHDAAHAMFEKVDEHLEWKHVDPTNQSYYRRAHVRTLVELGKRKALAALFERMLETAGVRLETAFRLSPRATFEVATQVRRDLVLALGLVDQTDAAAALQPRLLGMLETLRGIAVQAAAAQVGVHGDADLQRLRDDAVAACERLAGFVNGGPREGEDLDAFRGRIDEAVAAKELAERELRMEGRLAPLEVLDLEKLPVPTGAAAILDHRLPRLDGGEELVAFVLPGLRKVALGDAAKVDALVIGWRASFGQPVNRGRAGDKPKQDPWALAFAIQQAVLAPVLQDLPADTRVLHVCPDAALHLVPLDCLPTRTRPRDHRDHVGDRFTVVLRPHLGPRTEQRVLAAGLLAMGGIDYGVPPVVPPAEPGAGPPRWPDPLPVGRWGMVTNWESLPKTASEAETICQLHQKHRGLETAPIVGADATVDRFKRDAPRHRFLHLATHGFFIPDVARSDGPETESQVRSLEDQVHGLAPMTLCGLVFAGANLGVDDRGLTPGLLTAEELATLDLSATELAVLSACDTNAGLRTSGLGIHSIQTALHCAGVRRTITSLWRVDDRAAHTFMQRFYEGIWKAPKGKQPRAIGEALWAARLAMAKDPSVEPKDWMAFVLSSDSW
jgi:CHAT domain-containing protein